MRKPDALKGFSGVENCVGDTTQPETLRDQLSDCDAVIHLVGIIREFPNRGITFKRLHVESTRHLLQAAKEQGIERYLQMSANGTREHAGKVGKNPADCPGYGRWEISTAAGKMTFLWNDTIFPAVLKLT